MRVSNELLNNQLKRVNGYLKNHNLQVNGRYGYYALDIGENKSNKIYDTLITGKTKGQCSDIIDCIEKVLYLQEKEK